MRDRPIVTLCSGRPIGFVECLCRLVHNTMVPCIGENGVWLWRPMDNSFECDPAITEDQLEIVHEARKLLRRRYQTNGVVQQPGKTASISLYHSDTTYLKSIASEIALEFERRDWPIGVSMTWFYINCDLRHVNKATAIDRLLQQTGMQPERTVGIGDTMGDKYIAERVAWFACPANAAAEIKSFAHYVSPYVEVAGVLDILEELADSGE